MPWLTQGILADVTDVTTVPPVWMAAGAYVLLASMDHGVVVNAPVIDLMTCGGCITRAGHGRSTRRAETPSGITAWDISVAGIPAITETLPVVGPVTNIATM